MTMPKPLTRQGQKAYKAIVEFLKENDLELNHKDFYTPKEWRDRGECYGTKSILVITHDGGDMAPLCDLNYGAYDLHNKFANHMVERGFFVEGCTSWYSAVYEA